MVFIYGNWKMYMTCAETSRFFEKLLPLIDPQTEGIALFPPFTALATAQEAVRGTKIAIGAQTVSAEEKGAYTGEIAPFLLQELGVNLTLVGHSERRRMGETPEIVMQKLACAQKAGMQVVLCIGETAEEFEKGQTEEVLKRQLHGLKNFQGLSIAYEPVWAIGTGKVASSTLIRERFHFLQAVLKTNIPLLYGGSVTPENLSYLLEDPDIHGFLIGGASLNPSKFATMIHQVMR